MRRRLLRPNALSTAPRRHVCLSVSLRPEPIPVADDGWLPAVNEWVTTVRGGAGEPDARRGGDIGYSASDWWDYLYLVLSRRNVTWVWVTDAHVTMTALRYLDELDSDRLTYRWGAWDAHPFIQNCRSPAGSVVFVALENWLDYDTAELCELAGHPLPAAPKPPLPEIYDPACLENRHLALVELVSGILRFRDYHDLGKLCFTVGAQALQLYRHRLGPRYTLANEFANSPGEPLPPTVERVYPVNHGNGRALELEQAACHGGVFRVFRRGRVEGPIHVADVQSCYGLIMRNEMMPVRLVGHTGPMTVAELANLAREFAVIAAVRVGTDDTEYPVRLPAAGWSQDPAMWGQCFSPHHDAGRVCGVAAGRFDTVLGGAELEYALLRDHVGKVYEVAYYDQDYLFRDYAEALWKIRQEHAARGEVIAAKIAKLLLASLWGKFGQHRPVWRVTKRVRAPERWGAFWGQDRATDELRYCRAIAGQVEERLGWELHPNAFPALAACVTAAARRYVWTLVERAGERQCYYLAVDALHLTTEGLRKLTAGGYVKPDTLGSLAVKRVLPWAYYHSPTAWWTEGDRSVSGVPTSAAEIGPFRFKVAKEGGLRAGPMLGPHRAEVSAETILDVSAWRPPGAIDDDGWVSPLTLGTEPE